MGKGEQMSVFEENPSEPKVHGSDLRRVARQRRWVCIALFVALLPFAITRSYLICTYSDAPSETARFFEAEPAVAGEDAPEVTEVTNPSRNEGLELETAIFGNSTSISTAGDEEGDEEAKPSDNLKAKNSPILAEEDVSELPEVIIPHSNSSGTKPVNDVQTRPESRIGDPELQFPDAETRNLTSTSTAGGEEGEEEAKAKKSPIWSNFGRSRNISANSSLSDARIGTGNGNNASSASYLESLRGTPQSNATKATEPEPTASEIVMEGTTAPAPPQNSSILLTSEGECNLEQGKWVPDSTPPLYTSGTCKYIQGHQNCHKNGRPDDGYLYWKWKPELCDLPRIDASAYLTAMRNRSIVFAGDSIARNQFQSLLCVLSQAEVPRHTYWSEDGRNNKYHFRASNSTLSIRWSPYLVRVEDKPITWPDNNTETVTHVYVDELDPNWVTVAAGADILHISTGQWWYKRAVYLEKKKALGCHLCPSCVKQIGFHIPYSKAIRNVLKGSLQIPGFHGTTVYRSFSPEHFENGAWDTGGACARTTPGGVLMSYDTTTLLGIQRTQFTNVTKEIGKDRLKFLGVTELAQSRADGHPNKYRSEEQKRSEKIANGVPNDCLHWCLPGPIDTWNDLLVHSLRDVIFN